MEQTDERIENATVDTAETGHTEVPTTEPEVVEQAEVAEQTEVVEQPKVVEQTEVAEQPKVVEQTEVVEQPKAPEQPQVEKKPMSKKTLITIVGCAAAALIVAIILIFTVFRPASIYKDACAALERKDFVECQMLLDKIPNHKKAPELKRNLNLDIVKSYIDSGDLELAEGILATMPGDARGQKLKEDIIYKRASDAVAHEKYEDAQEYLDKIPNHEDPEQLRTKLTYQDALQCVEQGDYETAYELMSSLGDYEDAPQQKEMFYYEALAFHSLLDIQSSLKNPSSLRVKSIGFYKSKEDSTDRNILHEVTASNSFGGNVGGLVYDVAIYEDIKAGKNDAGFVDVSTYNDPDDYYEQLVALLVSTIRNGIKVDVTVDVARMNRLLENNVTFKINLDFQSDETVEH